MKDIIEKSRKMMDFIEHCNRQENLSSLKPLADLEFAPIQRTPSPLQPATVDEVDNREYRIEEERLRSYGNWPIPHMEPARLAAAGFYYTGEIDKVRCFECKLEMWQWHEGDNPMTDHQRHRAECRFIRRLPCGNVPIGEDPNNVPRPKPRSRDVCGTFGVLYAADSSADCQSAPAEVQLPSAAKLGTLGIGRPKGPRFPEYATYDARLRTFDSWPKAMPVTKESLADAGFYYTGRGDNTRCFQCGAGLNDWEPNDDPWKQHALWFSKCYYVLTVKGQGYVNSVTGLTMEPPSKEETMKMNIPSCLKEIEPVKEIKKSCDAGPSSESSFTVAIQPEAKEIAEAAISGTQVTRNATKPLDDRTLCKICYGEEVGVVFLPCKHMVTCVRCAPAMTTCPLCREPITLTVLAILS